jgi:hypothetical protein
VYCARLFRGVCTGEGMMPIHRTLSKIELKAIHEAIQSGGKQQTGEFLRLYRKATGELPIATGEQPTVKRSAVRPTTQPLARQNVMPSGYDISLENTICMPAFQEMSPKQPAKKTFTIPCNLRMMIERGATLDQAVLHFIEKYRKRYHCLPDCIQLNFKNIIAFINADLIHEGNLREILFRSIIPVETYHQLNDDFMMLVFAEIALPQQKVG